MIRFRGRDQKNLNFHVFLSSTLIGKNNSIRVERHKLLLCISKEQANETDHYLYKFQEKTQKTARATGRGVDKENYFLQTYVMNTKRTHVPVGE